MIIGTRITTLINHNNICSKSYIQNGLVAMWDGIENSGVNTHSSNATIWKDLVGNYDFTLRNIKINSNNLESLADSANYGYLGSIDSINNSSIDYATHPFTKCKTLQVVVEYKHIPYFEVIAVLGPTFNSAPPSTTYINERRSLVAIYDERSVSTGSQTGSDLGRIVVDCTGEFANRLISRSTDKLVSYTSSYGNNTAECTDFFINVTRQTEMHPMSSGNMHYTNYPHPYIFGRQSSGTAIAGEKIYAIRLYDHVFTEEEVAYNYAIDKLRFKLP